MRKIYLFLLTLLVVNIYAADNNKVITSDLQTYLNQKTDNELIRVNVRLSEQMNQLNRYAQLQKMKPEIRRQSVVSSLKAFHSQSQTDMMSFLSQKSSDEFKLVRQYWIANVITAYMDANTIYQLAQRSDIDRIDIDEERQLIEAVSPEPVPFIPGEKEVNEITYNVLKVNAPAVWDLGYTGEGVIVSVIDAGINYNHVDLADHMWTSDEYPNHGYDFHNNDNDPMDGHGHGTHCAGTVAGDGTAGSQTGMAPDASLMGCKVLGDDGSGQESNVWAAIEFSVEQGANIISMSLGWQHAWNPDRETWRTTYDNTLAAGVVASVAAGNEGGSTTNPDDVRTPGDCPPPWLNPDQTLQGGISAVVCVGATNSSDGLASFSSRGPSDWSTVEPFFDYPFNPEMGLLRPDVSAPGVDVKSCNAFNPNGYTVMSGTSMATPGVAGVMALLMSKNPGLTPEEICMTLETTAVDLGEPGKDNLFGSGRVDALVAIENTSEQGPVYESHVFVDPNDNGQLEAGESVLLSLTLFNGSEYDFSNVDVTVTSESPFITMTDSEENYGDFPTGESVSVEEGFAFDVAENMPGLENIRFNITATDGTEVWESKFDVVSKGPKIAIGAMTIMDPEGNNNGILDAGESATIGIEVMNVGQSAISDLNLSILYENAYMTFENDMVSFTELAEESVEMAYFNVVVSDDVAMGQEDIFDASLVGGVYSAEKSFNLVFGITVEDWESGDFSGFNWEFTGGDWFVTDSYSYEGVNSAQSAGISDNQQTSMLIEYESAEDGSISFYKKVSSEATYDFLKFYIDGIERGSWSGEVDWSFEEYDVSAGIHEFKWTYSKDGSVSSGMDAGWVDYIIFPPMALPDISMENEAGICTSETYTSDAVVENYISLMWSTSGDGSFDDETIAMATYTPGDQDIANGFVDLVLTVTGGNGDIQSGVGLFVFPSEIAAPEAPQGTQVFCINPEDAVYEAQMAAGYELHWMLEPAEAGELLAMDNTLTVNWADDFTGEAMISVMTSSICAESEYSEALIVEIHDLPQLSLAAEMSACYGQDFMMSAELTGTAPWTVNIEGYGDMLVENSPMEMSWLAMSDSVMTVNWVQDANTCLNEEVSSVMVSVHEVPEILLADSTICMNHVITLNAGNAGAGFEWSTGESSQVISVDSAGMDENNQKVYTVWVTNEFDCTSEKSATITFDDCSGVDELGLSQWNLYPNPSNGMVELFLDSKERQAFTVEVLSMTGQLMFTDQLNLDYGRNVYQLNLTDLAPQTYLLVLKNNNQEVIKKLIIK